jgi:hypothetical protein
VRNIAPKLKPNVCVMCDASLWEIQNPIKMIGDLISAPHFPQRAIHRNNCPSQSLLSCSLTSTSNAFDGNLDNNKACLLLQLLVAMSANTGL